MKHLFYIFFLFLFSNINAQDHLVIDFDSGNNPVHLRLNETENNDYARMDFYTEPTFAQLLSGEWGRWQIAARSTGPNSLPEKEFSFWFVDAANAGDKILSLRATGDAFMDGTLTQGSDRNRKENITPISHAEILDKVAALNISQWNYIDQDVPHIGPMAQDFYAAFGLGSTDKGIAAIDSDGVALAAIQALKAENDALKLQLAKLAARIDGIMK